MAKYFKVSIIGSGNVAFHLAKALEAAGHTITEIYSRNLKHAQKLSSKLYEAKAKDDLDFSNSKSEIILIAVSDKAISSVLDQLSVPRNIIVAHTSGTESSLVFENLPNPYGVFYPIQSLSRIRTINFKEVPFSIEASDKSTVESLKQLASSLSKKIYFHNTEQRRVIHLASVFASNFSNHMFTISKGLLESNNLSFDIVKPLILEVVNKAFDVEPENAQTGPAIRKDYNTIEKHKSYLSEEVGLTKIYQAITEDIIKTYEE